MINIFKTPLIFLGGVSIGFGIGMITGSFLISEGTNYWLSIIISLIFGGFLSAFGFMMKKGAKEKIIEKEEDSDLEDPPEL